MSSPSRSPLPPPSVGIHTKDTRSERDTCTPMFIAAPFVIARTWKQPRCPSADEWTRKLWYIYISNYSFSCVTKIQRYFVFIIIQFKIHPNFHYDLETHYLHPSTWGFSDKLFVSDFQLSSTVIGEYALYDVNPLKFFRYALWLII